MARDVALEHADADEQACDRGDKRHLEGHQKMADDHEQRAERHGRGSAEPPVSNVASDRRSEIDAGRIEARDCGRERHRRCERAIQTLEEVPERCEPRDVLEVLRQQQVLREIQHEQRLHTVVREPLPGFREHEIPKATRVPEDVFAGRRREGSGHVFFPRWIRLSRVRARNCRTHR